MFMLFVMDTKYNVAEPWRFLTNAFVHESQRHLLGNIIAFSTPLALAGSVDYLSHGRGYTSRKRMWYVFISLVIVSSLLHHTFRVNFRPGKRYRALGASDSIVGMYGYSVASLPSPIKKIWKDFSAEKSFFKRIKLFVFFIYGLAALCVVSLVAFHLYCEDLAAYDVALQQAQKGIWDNIFDWWTGNTPEKDFIAHDAHMLGIVAGMLLANIFPSGA